MGKRATGPMVFSLTLAQLLVVCTLWRTTLVAADECGTKFTDPTSSTVLAQVVMQGTVRGLNPMPGQTGSHSANVTVGRVYKGMDVLRRVSPTEDMVMVSEFGQEDKDRCVASMEAIDKDEMHIFFLRQTADRNLLQMSAMPLPMESTMERRVRRSLCATCVRPPTIKKILCRDCAHAPKMKDMKPKKVKIGKRARLRCKARGKPPPTFSWHKSGLPIVSDSGGGITVKNKVTSSTLLIRRFTRAHKGLYTCTARNGVGESEETVYLDIQEQDRQKAKKKKERDEQNNVNNTRTSCETNVYCLNGGSCFFHFDLQVQVCVCPEEWAGLRCEFRNVSTPRSNTTEVTDRSNIITRERSETRPEVVSQAQPDTVSHRQPQIETARNNTVSRRQRPSPSAQSSTGSDTKSSASAGPGPDPISGRPQTPLATETSAIESQATGSAHTRVAEEGPDVSNEEDIDENNNDNADEELEELSSHDVNRLRSRLKKSRLKVVYCKDKHYCKNGGRCRIVTKLSTKFCECPEGFGGKRCEIAV